MRLLVLASDYPKPNGSKSQYYIHTRNKGYVNEGVRTTVLSFSTKEDYNLDNVEVISLETFQKIMDSNAFDILISHAPNLRYHYRFLKDYGIKFKRKVFFFHGHEVLMTSVAYPKPFQYTKSGSVLSRWFTNIYDWIKLRLWQSFFSNNSLESELVFVSNWMYEMFLKYTKIKPSVLSNRYHIIPNSIGLLFEKEQYQPNAEKHFDFITIRGNIDTSKYCIDVVRRIAIHNPEFKFCIIGHGNYFEHFSQPDNLTLIKQNLNHAEIISMLNRSRIALMPTRTDAQGVMACEMASFGIPLMTSDISVCKQVFQGFQNVRFISNDTVSKLNKDEIEDLFTADSEKNQKYYAENTIKRELELFTKMVSRV